MKCTQCGEEVDELQSVKVDGKRKRVCESCAEAYESEENIAAEAESQMGRMMEYKGRG